MTAMASVMTGAASGFEVTWLARDKEGGTVASIRMGQALTLAS